MWLLLFRAAGWLAVIVIIVLSVVPGQNRPHHEPRGEFDHLVVYLVASVVLGIGYSDRKTQTKLVLFLVLLSGLLEVFQLWIPGRHSELAGFLASSSGAALGMIAGAIVASRRRPPPR
jgi:VanZ family protein